MRALFVAILFAIVPVALAGKVYRCADGSYQDKPCGQGERVITSNNRHAAPPPGADKACFERGKAAHRYAKLRDGNTPIEKVLENIERSGKSYQQQLDEKTFAVKVYQTKGSAVEVQTLFESECVKETAKTAPPPAPTPVAAPEQAKPAPKESGESKEMANLCNKLKLDKKSVQSKARAGASGDELEELADQRKLIDEQLRELCS